uniref:Ribosomal protein S18 n=1 Tax=Neotessella volvocina TaxID=52559 RepID=A0A3G2QZS9_9STRA|nr:ribosomal protein S18 [Neotessella volvocina]
MSYFNPKQKRNNWNTDKKRTNWNQSLKSRNKINRPKKIKRRLQYLLVLRKFENTIDYKNIKLLKAFLTKYGKIRPRRKTRISVQNQKKVSKAIRKARALQVIPFTFNVKI